MAVKKKKAGAGSDSKTALIVSLVCFVLLSIGLGVFCYIAFDGQNAEHKKAEDAEKKATANKKGEEWQEYQKLLFMVHSGHATPEDVNRLESLRGRASGLASDGDRKKTEELVAKWEKDVGKDPVAQKKTYLDQIDQLKKTLDNTQASLKEANGKLKESNDARQAAAEEFRQATDKFRNEVSKLKTDLQTAKDERSEAFTKQMEQVTDIQKKDEALVKSIEAREKEAKSLVDARDKKIADQQTLIEKQKAKIAPLNPLLYDRPKGTIVQVQRGNAVYVNVGSADHVKEGLTFSVTGKTTSGKATGEPKGSIEVVGIVGPHLAKARITSVRNKFHEPILEGDLLFNPAWSPTMREHIAVAGLIDLTGDGRDSTQEFIKNLQKQNIEVDAYLDLKDLTIKGRGMDAQTGFLVTGEVPEFSLQENLAEGDKGADRKRAINDKITEMRLKADDLGVEKIQARRFMALIGYHLPRGATQVSPPNFSYQPGVTTNVGSGEPKEPAAKEPPAKEPAAKEPPAKDAAKDPAKEPPAKEEKGK